MSVFLFLQNSFMIAGSGNTTKEYGNGTQVATRNAWLGISRLLKLDDSCAKLI